jgi:hypothetical protein
VRIGVGQTTIFSLKNGGSVGTACATRYYLSSKNCWRTLPAVRERQLDFAPA